MSRNASCAGSAEAIGIPGERDDPTTHRRALRFLVVYAIMFSITQWPLYAIEHPDIVDFPNHLARFHILRHLAESASLQTYYAAFPHAIFPNLAMEIAVPLLNRWMDTALALKVFASLATLALTTGAIALARVLTGRLQYLALGVLMFANNAIYQLGLFNFLFGVGLALWLLAAWIAAPRWRGTLRGMAFFTAGAGALYVCHLAALAVYGLGAVAWQVRMTLRAGAFPLRVYLREPLATLAPLSVAAVWHLLFAAPTGYNAGSMTSSFLPFVAYKIVTLMLAPGAMLTAYPIERGILGALLIASLYLAFRRGVITFSWKAARLAVPLAFGLVVAPPAMLGSALADTRLMVPIALVLWCGLQTTEARDRRVLVPIVGACMAVSALTALEWSARDTAYRALRQAFSTVPPGATIASVTLDDRSTYLSPHAAGWAVVDRSVFMANLYSQPFLPVWLAYRPEYVALADRGRTENVSASRRPTYDTVKDRFDYVLVMGSSATAIRAIAGVQVVYDSDWARLVRTR